MIGLSIVALANAWIFARFTVDDAFITWRYGHNLIAHGLWAYNPTPFDLTQAYTNPLFAALSIVPAAIGLDVVLFFKLLSLVVLITIGALALRVAEDRSRMALVLLMLLAVPATLAHAFSGLETVLYCGALGLFFIYLQTGRWRAALIATLILVLTRPEAWLLFGLYPLALGLAWWKPVDGQSRPSARLIVRHLAVLAATGAAYFGFHLWYFGQALPNTFFVKSGSGFSATQAMAIFPYLLPALIVLALGPARTGLLMLLYFGAVAYSYASSHLLMNYLQRFPFQIVAPMTLYLGWWVARRNGLTDRTRGWATLGIAIYLGAFAWQARGLGDHLGIANYYPRLLDSHIALGRALNQAADAGQVQALAISDAGAPAYFADIAVLDTIGLASARVAHQGLTLDTVRAYAPDVLAFLATTDGLREASPRDAPLWTYVAETGMHESCELVWARHYTLRIYLREDLPALTAVCARSQRLNSLDELHYALRNLSRPPWVYWHE